MRRTYAIDANFLGYAISMKRGGTRYYFGGIQSGQAVWYSDYLYAKRAKSEKTLAKWLERLQIKL